MLVKEAMHARSLTAEPHMTLPEAVVKMQELRVKRLPVVHDGKVVGLLTDGEIRRNLPALSEGLTPWEFVGRAARVRVRDAMRQPVHTVTPDSPLEQAIQTMLERRIGGMPVVDDSGQLVGMLTLTDVLRAEQHAPRLQWGSAEQHMTAQVVTAQPQDDLADAAKRLQESRLRVLPVVEGGQLVGLLHETAVTDAQEKALAVRGQAASDQAATTEAVLRGRQVSELMKLPTGYVQEGSPMRDVLQVMIELDVHGLPVVDMEGQLLGVVTISDVLRGLLGQGQPSAQHPGYS
ncbi:CBS domain-containing protein [Deinococcus sp.]|uniref:CBS domain-containing protein n=1 Tax=Deinococcus sp. TaxID=47478 RepID=UPI0025BE3113|nr:CBS domain-containing protein [Deinococcus sp.]